MGPFSGCGPKASSMRRIAIWITIAGVCGVISIRLLPPWSKSVYLWSAKDAIRAREVSDSAVAQVREQCDALRQFESRFPDHVTGAHLFNGPQTLTSQSLIHGRYMVNLTVAVRFDLDRQKVVSVQPKTIGISEITEFTQGTQAVSFSMRYNPKSHRKLDESSWSELFESDDLAVFELELIEDQPVEGLDLYWQWLKSF